jgi:hypothetical protein
MAGARNVSVAVNDTTRDVALAIEHDAPAEVHLTSVADRIDALGGTITATEHPDADPTHSVTCLIPTAEPMASLR